jgi:CHAD domain-containing protein
MARAWLVPGLARDVDFRDAAGRIILTRWREMMSYRDGTLDGSDIEQLHAMRVSSRRLRAAMDAFAEAFPARSFRIRLAVVKEITDTLGAARDLDVAIEGLERVSPEFTDDEQIGIAALADGYRRQRATEDDAIGALFGRLHEQRYDKRFERWVARHTGVDRKALRTGPGEL